MTLALIFIVAPLVLATGTVATTYALRTARERARRRRLLATLGAPATDGEIDGATAGAELTIEGVLGRATPSGGAPSQGDALASFHPHGTSYLEVPNVYAIDAPADDELVLDLGGGRTAKLDGRCHVLVGDAETAHGVSAESAATLAPPNLAPKLTSGTGQLRVVPMGATVRARGVVDPAPDDAAGYREKTRVLRVHPADPSAPLALAATRADARPLGRSRGAIATVVAGAVVTGLCATLYARGGLASWHEPADVPEPFIATAAAIAPPPACRAQIEGLLRENHLREARAAAADCNDARSEALAAFANGEHSAASDAFERAANDDAQAAPSIAEAEAHLFAHQPTRAARAVHRMLDVYYPGPTTEEKRYLECIASMLDVVAKRGLGGPDEPRFEDRHPLGRQTCSKATTPRFALELEAEGGFGGGFDWYAPSYEAVRNPFTAALGTRGRMVARPVGIERRVLGRYVLGEKPPVRKTSRDEGYVGAYGNLSTVWGAGSDADRFARLSAWAADVALFYAWSGQREQARPFFEVLDRIATGLEATPPRSWVSQLLRTYDYDEAQAKERMQDERTMLAHTMTVAGGAALAAGDDARMKRYTALGESHGSGTIRQLARMLDPKNPWEKPIEDGHWHDHVAVFEAGIGGDGQELAALLRKQGSTGASTLPRVLPRLAKNRDAVARWFDEAFPPAPVAGAATVLLGHLVDRRTVAELVSAEGAARELDAPIARFAGALTDPLIAYEINELETFFAPHR